MAAVVAVLALSTALLGALVIGLLRSHADILRALHDLGVDPGATAAGPRRFGPAEPPAPDPVATSPTGTGSAGPGASPLPDATDVQGTGPDGTAIHLAVTGVDHQTLLAFLTTGCELCLGFWDALADPRQRDRLGRGVRIVAVTQGEASEMPSAVAAMAPADVTTVMAPDAWEAYGVPVAPFFALVDGPSGRVVGEGAAPSWDQLVDLLGRVATDRPVTPGGGRPGDRRGWRAREADTDAALLAAGITPGDPRLHHEPAPAAPDASAPPEGTHR